jgi:uncharacterized protein YjiS (DUF1127 family)
MTTIDTQLARALGNDHRRGFLDDLVTAGITKINAMLITLLDWQYQARQRRQLLGLSDRDLKDFGAGRADAEREGCKPFWQP